MEEEKRKKKNFSEQRTNKLNALIASRTESNSGEHRDHYANPRPYYAMRPRDDFGIFKRPPKILCLCRRFAAEPFKR